MDGYDAINAKLGAMRGRLLTREDYYGLAGCATVADAARSLAERESYFRALAPPSGGEVNRSCIEKNLMFSLMADIKRIQGFARGGGTKRYFDGLYVRAEVRALKYLLPAIHDRRAAAYTEAELGGFLGRRHELDLGKLIRSGSGEEFADNLLGTPYGAALQRGKGAESLETALDLYYYTHVWKYGFEKLDKGDKKALRHIHGTEIDLRNIIAAYRLKLFYAIAPQAVYPYLIPVNYRIGKKQLTQIVEADNGEALRNAVLATVYGSVFGGRLPECAADVKPGADGLDGALFLGQLKAYKSMLAKNSRSVVGIAYYLFRKEMELNNVVMLTEGVRYSLSRDEIMKMLIL